MPVTKTAKRALRSSDRKKTVNKILTTRLEVSLREVKKSPTANNVKSALSLIDKAVKKNIFHKNKAARLKSKISSLSKKRK